MKTSKFTETQIIKKQEAGTTVKEICRELGIAEPTFYKWKAKYGGRNHTNYTPTFINLRNLFLHPFTTAFTCIIQAFISLNFRIFAPQLMNLKFPLFVLSLFITCSANAQQSIGIQAGVGRTMVRSEVFKDQNSPKVRPNLGLSYERFLSRHVTLGADLLYQQRGFSDVVQIADENGQAVGTAVAEFRYSYAALPLKVGYSFGKKGFGFGKLGLVPAVLLKAVSIAPDGKSFQQKTYDNTSEVNRFDLGGIAEAGGGYRFESRCQLYASLGFQQSFTSFSGARYFGGIPLRHYGWFLSLGFRYELASRRAPAAPAAQG